MKQEIGQTLYEKSRPGRGTVRPPTSAGIPAAPIPEELRRSTPAELPEVPESEVVRHFTRLSQQNFSVDTHFYPLGSCTMKYNPRACEAAAAAPGFTAMHPLWAQLPGGEATSQGALELLHNLEQALATLTGMAACTLQPLAGSHGEFTGAMIMAAYHRERGNRKTQIIIPDSAHGTNPSSAALMGYDVVTVPSGPDGLMDFGAFKAAVNEQTAGLMLTTPNTMGAFNWHIRELAEVIHGVDGLMYYDGANLNAILGRCKPGEMGFDVCHLNLHKTFSTPHGGGGPGAGPVAVVERLRPYLPVPRIIRGSDAVYRLDFDAPRSVGRMTSFYGNFGVLVRAYAYILMLGHQGMRETSGMAVLHANYVQEKLRALPTAFKPVLQGRCMHECVFSGSPLAKHGVRTLDIAKALLDYGIHAPTVYFPLNVPEALMIEPTETETRETLDRFIAVLTEIAATAATDPGSLHACPSTTPVGRLDEVKAAREMLLVFPLNS